MRAAAAPIHGLQRLLAGVIWVAGFSRHIGRDRLAEIAKIVASEAADVSRRLGAIQR